MPAYRVIWEVVQQVPGRERSLGYFTDDNLADRVIEALYRQVWKEVMTPGFIPSEWLAPELYDVLSQQGWDIWWVNDSNSDDPMFIKRSYPIWNHVPTSFNNFTFEDRGEYTVVV